MDAGTSWLTKLAAPFCLLLLLLVGQVGAQAAAPTISGFTPTSGPVGTVVTINGTGLFATTQITFNGTNASFIKISSFSIQTTVPAGASTGPIVVTNTQGSASTAPQVFTVTAGVTGFSPRSGPVGTSVVISGNDLTGTSDVTFNGVAATFTVDSDTQITAVVPDGAQSGAIQLTTPSGVVTTSTSFLVIPRIDSITPGIAAVGDTVTISGKTFTGAILVRFYLKSANYSVVDDSTIVATVPQGAQSGQVSVTTRSGTGYSTQSFFLEGATPTITSFTSSAAVGANMAISGTNFGGTIVGSVNDVTIDFPKSGGGTISVNPTSINTNTSSGASSMVVKVPDLAVHGPLTVTTPVGSADTTSLANPNFHVTPTITSFTPIIGPSGTEVAIEGSALTVDSAVSGTQNPPEVNFGSATFGVPGTPAASEATTITPDAADGYHKITAVVPNGAFSGLIYVRNFYTASPVLSVIGSSSAATPSTTFYTSPRVTTFSPASGTVGSLIVINGANFVSGRTDVKFTSFSGNQDLDAGAVTYISATQVRVAVPDGATHGPVFVTTTPVVGDTDLSATSSANFIVTPKLNSLTPAQGYPGDAITISGFGLTAAGPLATDPPVVTFYNGQAATVTASDYHSVTAVVPPLATTGIVTVKTSTSAGGTGSTTFNFAVAPRITSFTPLTGPIGTPITVNGANFVQGATSVKFGILGVPSQDITVISTTQLRVLVPNNLTYLLQGPVPISATTTAGTGTSTQMFQVTGLLPTITSFSPTFGPAGTVVTITGTNFTPQMLYTAVTFNGVNSTNGGFTYVSPTEIHAKAPTGVTAGPIRVINDAGTAVSDQDYTPGVPTVTTVTPTTGPVGAPITIGGTNFTRNSVINFTGAGGTTVPGDGFVYTANNSIRANVPAGAVSGPITVTNDAGTSAASTIYFVPEGQVPTITDFSPTFGPGGTTVVTINGTNFTPQIAYNLVTFNGVASLSGGLVFVSPTQLQVKPPTTVTAGPIRISNAAGQSAPSTHDYTPGIPTITSTGISPVSGPAGAWVTISGTNFTHNAVVNFSDGAGGTVPGDNFTWISNAKVTVNVPATAATGTITVTNDAGDSLASTQTFTVTSVPVVTDFTPGSAAVGSTIDVTGANFTGATLVTFTSAKTAVPTVVSDSELTVNVPTGVVIGPITVKNAAGTSPASRKYFVPTTSLPTISTAATSVNPSTGPTGQYVTITGTNFTPNSVVNFTAAGGGYVAATSVWAATTSIAAYVPDGVAAGPVTVTNEAGTSNPSTVYFVPEGQVPTITDFSPTTGTGGSTVVTINGTNFTPQITTTLVTFNNVASLAGSLVFVSPTQLQVKPPTTVTTGPIRVSNAAGQSAPSADYFVPATAKPTVTSFTPSTGPVGSQVIVTGTNFTPNSTVQFTSSSGTVNGTGTIWVSTTQIKANVPSGAATGPLTVTNEAGTSNPSTVYFVPSGKVPTISSFTPTFGPGGTTVVTIDGTNFTPQITTTMVSFNGVASLAGSFVFVSPTEIQVKPPTTVTAGPIRVANAAGTSVPSVPDYTPGVPTIAATGVSPLTGVANTVVTLTGTNFTEQSVVNFTAAGGGTTTATFYAWLSSSVIQVRVPSDAVTGPITVTTDAGTSAPSAQYFVPAGAVPTITDISPTSGPIGTLVTITGTNFTPQSTVQFSNGAGTAQALTLAGNVFVDSTQIQVKAPSNVATGKIKVNNAAGSSALSSQVFTKTS